MSDQRTDLIVTRADDALAVPSSQLELAVAAWLDAKGKRTGSSKTSKAYRETLASFRTALQTAGLDLDSEIRAVALAAQVWASRREPSASREEEVSPATFNQRLAILSSFYTYADRHDLLAGENPIRKVERRPVQAYANVTALSVEAVRQALKVIDRNEQAGLRDYALLAVALHTGRRLSELAALQWNDVQNQGSGVTLTFRRAKGGKVMRDALPIGVGQALLRWLSAYYAKPLEQLPAATPLWVSLARNSRGGKLSVWGIGDICQRRLGTRHVHLLRHTFARLMEDSGAKVSEIQARLGHSSLATTGRYLAALKSAENPHGERIAALLEIEEQ